MIRVEVTDRIGSPNWITAEVVDIIDGGFGVILMSPLESGARVLVRGKSGGNRPADYLQAGVRWCVAKPDGTFRAGLEFLDTGPTLPLDCYEVMQLSPNADPYTISRVYRMLASRYHPDNTETGNSEKFIRLAAAHQILSDPEKRARFDVRYRDAASLREKIFDQTSTPPGNGEDNRKRVEQQKILSTHGARSAVHFPPSVGALHGWNAAARYPRW